MRSEGEPETWSKPIRLANNFQDDLLLSETLRDSLLLIGWPLPWETWHDSTGLFHFALEHPGKRYVVDYTFKDQVAHVQEIPKGFWRVFNNMHGSGAVPNSMFMKTWKWYSRITVVLVVFSVFLGIYLWHDGTRDKKTGWYMLMICVFLSLAWMIQLYYSG
jgi:hypothetical protein